MAATMYHVVTILYSHCTCDYFHIVVLSSVIVKYICYYRIKLVMNIVLKLCRHNFANRNILHQLTRTQHVSYCNKLKIAKLCNTSKVITVNQKQKFKLILASSLLTWLGFTKDDEEKESELIMTIKRAILMTQRGEYPKAEQMLHLALRLSQEQQNQQGILYVYDLMANLALERGEVEKAQTLFVSVLQRLLTEGIKQDDIKVIHISLKMARIYHMKGEKDKAEIGFHWCLDNIKKKLSESNDNDFIALNGIVQDWYAQFLLETGQLNESLKYLKEAHRISTEIQGANSEKSILLLNDLGTACWRIGDLESAQEYLNRAVQLGKGIDDFDYLGVIYANLGLVYLQNGVLNEAKKHCKEGWRLGKKQKSADAVEQANYCFEQIKSHA